MEAAAAARRQAERDARERQRQRALSEVRSDPAAALARIGVPPRFRDARLDACPDLPANLMEYLHWWASEPSGILFLHGAVGSGKTWAAVAVLREIILAGILPAQEARFIDEGEFLLRLKAGYGRGEGDRPARNRPASHPRIVRLLVLDELGATAGKPWAVENVASLVGGRHADLLPTIITSNFSLDALARQLDPRISSRLAEAGQVLEFPARDLRIDGSHRRPAP